MDRYQRRRWTRSGAGRFDCLFGIEISPVWNQNVEDGEPNENQPITPFLSKSFWFCELTELDSDRFVGRCCGSNT